MRSEGLFCGKEWAIFYGFREVQVWIWCIRGKSPVSGNKEPHVCPSKFFGTGKTHLGNPFPSGFRQTTRTLNSDHEISLKTRQVSFLPPPSLAAYAMRVNIINQILTVECYLSY